MKKLSITNDEGEYYEDEVDEKEEEEEEEQDKMMVRIIMKITRIPYMIRR